MDFDIIFITGPQGSGKGTQGKMLAKKLGFLFWDTGAILRELMEEDTPLAKKIAVINNGTLLSDEVIIEVLKERLGILPQGQGVVFDGVPRRLGQAEFILKYLRDQHRKKPITIFLSLPRETSLERLLSRAKKEGREDDTLRGIEKRLDAYDEATKPTLEYLRKETRFMEIDGRPAIAEIEKNIDAALGLK